MWHQKEVRLELYRRNLLTGAVRWDYSLVKECPSRVLGNLAVTAGPKDDQVDYRWWVILISISHHLCTLQTEAAAMRVAETLWNRCASLLLKPSPREVRDSLPWWVKPWLARCNTSGQYEEP